MPRMPSSFASSPCSRMLLPIRAPGNHRPPAYRTSTTIGFSVHLHSPMRTQSAGARRRAVPVSRGASRAACSQSSRRAVAARSVSRGRDQSEEDAVQALTPFPRTQRSISSSRRAALLAPPPPSGDLSRGPTSASCWMLLLPARAAIQRAER